MKQALYKTILAHPILQMISFLLIVIGGQVFSAPYGWILRYAVVTGEVFAILGIAAIFITLLSLFVRRLGLQYLGLLTMWLSLGFFYVQTRPEARSYMFGEVITVITLLVFVFVSVCVILKRVRWKSY